MIEIERKFLVKSNAYKSKAFRHTRIIQGFLNTDPERTVRVRIRDSKGMITIKGKSSEDGLSRFEWEKEIDKNDAKALLALCEDHIIDKIRYEIKVGEHTFEVDEFSERNEGLVIAEVELNHKNDSYKKPEWLGDEVTGIEKYYNSQLSKEPFKNWKQ